MYIHIHIYIYLYTNVYELYNMYTYCVQCRVEAGESHVTVPKFFRECLKKKNVYYSRFEAGATHVTVYYFGLFKKNNYYQV